MGPVDGADSAGSELVIDGCDSWFPVTSCYPTALPRLFISDSFPPIGCGSSPGAFAACWSCGWLGPRYAEVIRHHTLARS